MATALASSQVRWSKKRRAPRPSSDASDGTKAPKDKKTGRPFLTRPSKKKRTVLPETVRSKDDGKDVTAVQWKPASEQANWLTSTFYAVCGSKLAPIEREAIPENRVVQLLDEKDHSVESLSWHIKRAMGPSWKELLCGDTNYGQEKLKWEAGSPSLLVLGSSAIRCVELLRGLTPFTRKCKPVKLFAKHIKVEEQVTALNSEVRIAAGTPSRVKKLVDIGALGLGQLSLVILDMHRDAKGLTVLTVPEVMKEFWELYKAHLHQHVLSNQCRLCLY